MVKIVKVVPEQGWTVLLEFSDGLTKRVDIKPYIRGGLSDSLKDWEFFKRVSIESGGGITWPNGYDFCPDFLQHCA